MNDQINSIHSHSNELHITLSLNCASLSLLFMDININFSPVFITVAQRAVPGHICIRVYPVDPSCILCTGSRNCYYDNIPRSLHTPRMWITFWQGLECERLLWCLVLTNCLQTYSRIPIYIERIDDQMNTQKTDNENITII